MCDKMMIGLVGFVVGILLSAAVAFAGNPAGPGTLPEDTYSYTLQDIHNRLDSGAAGSQSAFTEPSAAPGVNTGDVIASRVGKGAGEVFHLG